MIDYVAARQYMVDGQISTSDVTNPRILEAMREIPRERFLPAAQQPLAYLDSDVALPGASGEAARYLVKPIVIARLLQAAELTSADKVLVVGCASGYSAALTARLAGAVVATDGDAALVASARATLAELGVETVTVEQAPAADGWSAGAPYDVIIFDGGTEVVPEGLYRQLRDGGRLVGVFALTAPQRALMVTRSQGDDFGSRVLFDIASPVLPGLERRPEFVF